MKKFHGYEVSSYGEENGYVDYATLAKAVGSAVLCNDLMEYTGYNNWEPINRGYDDGVEIFQYYIVPNSAIRVLEEADEIIYYNYDIGLTLWGVTHYGTSWDHVLTSIPI